MRRSFCFIFLFFFCAVSATLAGPAVRKDKGASNNGDLLTFAQCDSINPGVACGAYSTTSTPLDGTNVFQFVTDDGSGSDAPVVSDVFYVPGTITAGSTLTIDFNTSGSEIDYGDFACNNGSSAPVSADGKPMSGPCTIGNASDLASLFTEMDGVNSATFTFLAGAPTQWAFYVTDGDLASIAVTAGTGTGTGSSMPEPGSALLLLVGALAVGALALKMRS
jgi:hypothetical protein